MDAAKVSATLVSVFLAATLASGMIAEMRHNGWPWWVASRISLMLALLAFVALAVTVIWGF